MGIGGKLRKSFPWDISASKSRAVVSCGTYLEVHKSHPASALSEGSVDFDGFTLDLLPELLPRDDILKIGLYKKPRIQDVIRGESKVIFASCMRPLLAIYWLVCIPEPTTCEDLYNETANLEGKH